DERLEILPRPQFRIKLAMVDDVIPMRAPGARLQVRRRIYVRDPEVVQIRHDRRRVAKPKVLVKLEPVSRFERECPKFREPGREAIEKRLQICHAPMKRGRSASCLLMK